MNDEERVKLLIKFGYRRISKRYGLVSRIDRPDWKEALARTHTRGMEWVNAICKSKGVAEHYYRRTRSTDKYELGQAMGSLFPPSAHDSVGYIATPTEKAIAMGQEYGLCARKLAKVYRGTLDMYIKEFEAFKPPSKWAEAGTKAHEDALEILKGKK